MNNMKKVFFLLITTLFLWSTFAIDFKWDTFVTIDTPVDETLFIGATEVTVSTTVDGDLFVWWQHVLLDWTVTEDARIGWNTVIVNWSIQDDLRVWWNLVTISWRVWGDIMGWGNSFSVKNDVLWDVMIGWSSVRITWTIWWDATIWSEKLFLWSLIEWDVEFEWEELEFWSWARIVWDLTLPEKSLILDADLEEYVWGEIIRGETLFWWRDSEAWLTWESNDKSEKKHLGPKFDLFRFLSLIAMWTLLMWLMPNYIKKAGETIRVEPARSIWYGALLLILTPIVALILMMTWIGSALWWFLMANYMFLWVFLSLFAVIFFADLIVSRWFSDVNAHPLLVRVLIVIVLSALVSSLPYVVSMIVWLFGLGAWFINDMKILKRNS